MQAADTEEARQPAAAAGRGHLPAAAPRALPAHRQPARRGRPAGGVAAFHPVPEGQSRSCRDRTRGALGFLRRCRRSIDVGRLGVIIFFAISGFVICRSFGGPREGAGKRFVIRRLCRLYPAYWVSMLGGILVCSGCRAIRGHLDGLWRPTPRWVRCSSARAAWSGFTGRSTSNSSSTPCACACTGRAGWKAPCCWRLSSSR